MICTYFSGKPEKGGHITKQGRLFFCVKQGITRVITLNIIIIKLNKLSYIGSNW